MTSSEIRQKFLKFFEARGHAIVPSASLVPADYGDEGTLFTTAGMQPFIPYLLGKPHPAGQRLTSAQKCVRTGDIEDVGDNRHLTFFEMLGNWSLGDYFKQESIPWSFEFLTNKEDGLGLDPVRFYVTVFKGEAGIPRDEESVAIWQKVFSEHGLTNQVATDGGENLNAETRIIPLGIEDNFWIAGATGPCGGDTEIFYDTTPEAGPITGSFQSLVDAGRLIEIWNNVFMEFNKTADGRYEPLAAKNVDTGMGLERTTAIINNTSIFEIDLFAPLLSLIKENAGGKYNEKSARIVADHLRAMVFMLESGVTPTNTERGYVLRRLIRRGIRHSDKLGLHFEHLTNLVEQVITQYQDQYPELKTKQELIIKEFKQEEARFRQTLEAGLKWFEKIAQVGQISGQDAFNLFQSYGFPIELTSELARERGLEIDLSAFEAEMQKHQTVSKAGAEQKFKGGLAGESEQVIKYHTATHLLHQALTDVLGSSVSQKGSNITDERLRFDFAFERKLTAEEKKRVEEIVNEKIKANLPVQQITLPRAEAEASGARHLFAEKYGEEVSVYFIGESLDTAYSKEFCGGPHVTNTGTLGDFKITKEEAVAAGIRRIKAVLN